MASLERELDVLDRIRRSSVRPSQRELARAIGLSLGVTNAIVKRIARKGWLTIRKVNNRNIQYVVSPAGLEEISRRSYRYLRRTIGNVVRYRQAVEELVREAASRGCREAVLVGRSDLDFLVEHACRRTGVRLRTAGPDSPIEHGADSLVILSERLRGTVANAEGAVPLWSVLTDQQPVGSRYP